MPVTRILYPALILLKDLQFHTHDRNHIRRYATGKQQQRNQPEQRSSSNHLTFLEPTTLDSFTHSLELQITSHNGDPSVDELGAVPWPSHRLLPDLSNKIVRIPQALNVSPASVTESLVVHIVNFSLMGVSPSQFRHHVWAEFREGS